MVGAIMMLIMVVVMVVVILTVAMVRVKNPMIAMK